jgi:hypothetical protein
MDPAPALYMMRINGHLGASVLSAFPAMASRLQGAETVLTGLLDRSALYGVLAEVEALGLDLLEVVGSMHALTEGGSLLVASGSGSQLGPLVSGAGRVILVIGAQKIVSDVATGIRRIYEYCYPLGDARARRAYGVPSGVNNMLIIKKVMTAGRVTAIIVKERLGC